MEAECLAIKIINAELNCFLLVDETCCIRGICLVVGQDESNYMVNIKKKIYIYIYIYIYDIYMITLLKKAETAETLSK